MAAIRAASDRALLVSFGEEAGGDATDAIARLTHRLEGLRGILNLHPAAVSVLVEFDPRLRLHAEMEALVRERLESGGGTDDSLSSSVVAAVTPAIVEIPVRYGGEFGPDLEDVARHAGVSPERAIELHAAAQYRVQFLGFSPGFPYLSGLPPELATPRLAVPRKLAPAGSVAIGGSHAGIYPMDSPGGWRIIGRTLLRLFDGNAAPPALLAMGDRVRFLRIEGGRF